MHRQNNNRTVYYLLVGALITTGLGILRPPVLIVVTAGTGVWFLVRTTIKTISSS